jgi:hypothetical protein
MSDGIDSTRFGMETLHTGYQIQDSRFKGTVRHESGIRWRTIPYQDVAKWSSRSYTKLSESSCITDVHSRYQIHP